MNTPQWFRSEVIYIKRLAEAGANGISSVWNEPRARTAGSPGGNALWIVTGIGALAGGLRAHHSEIGGGGVGVRAAEADSVDGIEALGAELQAQTFAEDKVLEDREV